MGNNSSTSPWFVIIKKICKKNITAWYLSGARHGHCQLAIDNETIFIGGGCNSHLGQDLKTGEIYIFR